MIDRRRLLLASAATPLLGLSPALADGTRGFRRFRILRDGSDIGTHDLTATRSGDRFEIAIDIDIRVRLLGITAYRYTLENREVWDGGVLTSIDSKTDDDGEDNYARITRAGDQLEVDGSAYSGTAPLESVTTSYYARPFMDRRPWISTQTGKPLDVAVDPVADAPRTFGVSGDLDIVLIYDANSEWVGCRFDAGGEPGVYEMVENEGSIGGLWQSA